VDPRSGEILVCGIGGLGQACLRLLLNFSLPIRCLDNHQPHWIDAELSSRLEAVLVLGDMRNPDSLLQAGVSRARAVLLLCRDSGVNLEAALQVRLLNANAQLVVRSSSRRSLDHQLQSRLPGLSIIDPLLLTAGVFANALRPDGKQAAFELEGELFSVCSSQLHQDSADDLYTHLGRRQRLVQWFPAAQLPEGAPASGWWDLDSHPKAGDRLLWLELASTLETRPRSRQQWLAVIWARWRLILESSWEWLLRLARRRDPLWLWGLASLALMLVLGSLLFGSGSMPRGLLLTLALLKGEYLDAVSYVVSGNLMATVNLGLATLSLLYALVGTLFTAWVVALFLDLLLAQRLGQKEPRPLPAGTPYVLLVEGGRLARKLAQQLRLLKFQVVRVQSPLAEGELDGDGESFRQLDKALRVMRHCSCEAVGVLGNDLMANLETALNLQELQPQLRLAVQSHSLSEGARLSSLFTGVEVVNPLEVAADAVVATAFGERVRGVLRLADANLLLTEYRIKAGDTLAGLSLGSLTGGYGLIPLLVVPLGQTKPMALPNLERLLNPGDGLVVLATLDALLRVESGQLLPPRWRLEVRGCSSNCSAFEVQAVLARYLAGAPGEMARFLDTSAGPQFTPPIYQASGRMLQQALIRLGVDCSLISCAVTDA
jgi:Trk K+ transport system NAD-binding subunit